MERMKIVYNNALKSINAHKFKFLLFILSFAFALIFTICANCTTLVNGKYYGEIHEINLMIEINGNSFYWVQTEGSRTDAYIGLYHPVSEDTNIATWHINNDLLGFFRITSNGPSLTQGQRINAFSFSLSYPGTIPGTYDDFIMVCRWAVAVQIISGIIMFFDFTCAIIFFIKAYKSSKLKKD